MPGMSNPVGQLTTETSTYDGNTYTFQQTGFNVFGESLGETVTMPSAEGNLGGYLHADSQLHHHHRAAVP